MNKNKTRQQEIILDKSGFPILCEGTIFFCGALPLMPVTVVFPFVESIFPDLLLLSPEDFPIIYSIVAGNHSLLPGYYEYRFDLKENQHISWTIIDKNQEYQSLLIKKSSGIS